MPTFIDFSGRNIGSVVRFEQPTTLAGLRSAVMRAERDGLNVHAVGSAWAFSAPAYCEGVVIETRGLAGFPGWLQAAILNPERGTRLLVAVEAGIRIRDLYLALAGRRGDGDPSIEGLRRGRDLTPPTLGGAGGQSLAGAISTGTHGGDVARPPIGDFVHALVVVGSGGLVRVIQRSESAVLDFPRLQREIGSQIGSLSAVVDERSSDALDAALVSVGRFGVVYAYVFEVHDETGSFVFEARHKRSWSSIRSTLLDDVRRARAGDEYLHITVNPVPEASGDHTCYVTRHLRLPVSRVSDASRRNRQDLWIGFLR